MVWGAMCGDGSPYSTVHQVVPGGHVEETVQGELMREQLENRITQVRINSVQGVSNTNSLRSRKKKKGRALVEFTLLIVSWSMRTDLSQRTKAFTSGLEFVCEANPPSITHRDHNRSDGIRHAVSHLVDITETPGLFQRHAAKSLRKRMSTLADDPVVYASDTNQSGRNPELGAEAWWWLTGASVKKQ